MAKSTISCLFLLSALLFQCVYSDNLEDHCKKLVGPNLPYDFCVKALSADANSKNADVFGLGVISLRLTLERAKTLKAKVETLTKDPSTNQALKIALEDCLESYGDAVEEIQDALKNFEARHNHDTRTALTSISTSSMTCENSLSEMGAKSPIQDEMTKFKEMAVIPLALSNLMQRGGA